MQKQPLPPLDTPFEANVATAATIVTPSATATTEPQSTTPLDSGNSQYGLVAPTNLLSTTLPDPITLGTFPIPETATAPQLIANLPDNQQPVAPGTTTTTTGAPSTKRRRERSRPAFVSKLWAIVNDSDYHEIIAFSSSGDSFVVKNKDKLVEDVLPRYFKHSNFSSFVRQLNMYGWHKVQDLTSGSLLEEENWRFENPNFKRDMPDLLDCIVRNRPGTGGEPETNKDDAEPSSPLFNIEQMDVKLLINELSTLKSNQSKITQELARVRNDNDLLWSELFQTREKNTLQHEKIQKILHFLASVYDNGLHQINDETIATYLQPQLKPNSTQTTQQQIVQGPYNQPQQPIPLSFTQPLHQQQTQQLQQPQPQQPQPQQPQPQQTSFIPGSDAASLENPRLKQYHHVRTTQTTTTNSGSTPSSFPSLSGIGEIPVQEIIRSYPSPAVYHPQYQVLNQQPHGGTMPPPLPTQEPQTLQGRAQPQSQQPYPVPHQAAEPANSESNDQEPPIVRPAATFQELTNSINQQGQDIDDLITRLQNQQAHNPANDGSGKFDLDDYLEHDIVLDASTDTTTLNADDIASLNSTTATSTLLTSIPSVPSSAISETPTIIQEPFITTHGTMSDEPHGHTQIPVGPLPPHIVQGPGMPFYVPFAPQSVPMSGQIPVYAQHYIPTGYPQQTFVPSVPMGYHGYPPPPAEQASVQQGFVHNAGNRPELKKGGTIQEINEASASVDFLSNITKDGNDQKSRISGDDVKSFGKKRKNEN